MAAQAAEDYCEQLGGRLASIADEETQDSVSEAVASLFAQTLDSSVVGINQFPWTTWLGGRAHPATNAAANYTGTADLLLSQSWRDNSWVFFNGWAGGTNPVSPPGSTSACVALSNVVAQDTASSQSAVAAVGRPQWSALDCQTQLPFTCKFMIKSRCIAYVW